MIIILILGIMKNGANISLTPAGNEFFNPRAAYLLGPQVKSVADIFVIGLIYLSQMAAVYQFSCEGEEVEEEKTWKLKRAFWPQLGYWPNDTNDYTCYTSQNQ